MNQKLSKTGGKGKALNWKSRMYLLQKPVFEQVLNLDLSTASACLTTNATSTHTTNTPKSIFDVRILRSLGINNLLMPYTTKFRSCDCDSDPSIIFGYFSNDRRIIYVHALRHTRYEQEHLMREGGRGRLVIIFSSLLVSPCLRYTSSSYPRFII